MPMVAKRSVAVDHELTIVVRAQQAVDRWRQDRFAVSFEQMLDQSFQQPWDPFLAPDERRQAVRRVAEAIRQGRGHAFRNRAPPLAIARQTLRRTHESTPGHAP
jgi:hypothetical protein